MLDPALVETIRRMLAAGKWSMRKVARMTGVSRGTILAIAHGKRRDRPRRLAEESDPGFQPSGPLRRCPGCGGLVQMPCRLCRVRAWRAAKRPRRLAPRPEEPLRLDLLGEHRLRYEAVRARRLRDERNEGARG
jgi:hypothetical protein